MVSPELLLIMVYGRLFLRISDYPREFFVGENVVSLQ
jgi:hypothetical protein